MNIIRSLRWGGVNSPPVPRKLCFLNRSEVLYRSEVLFMIVLFVVKCYSYSFCS